MKPKTGTIISDFDNSKQIYKCKDCEEKPKRLIKVTHIPFDMNVPIEIIKLEFFCAWCITHYHKNYYKPPVRKKTKNKSQIAMEF